MKTEHLSGVIALDSGKIAVPAYHLHLHSALAYCTKLDEWDGERVITTVRPANTLSSGERVLWEALLYMAGGPGVLDLDSATLDAGNRAALATAVELWECAR